MITADGWFDWADRRYEGPPGKYYPEKNRELGIVFHSAEGGLAALIGELMKPDRQASWCGSIDKDGTLYQHYPVWRSCWTSGNKKANTTFYAFEAVGKRGEPLTREQENTVLRIIADGAQRGGWIPERKKTVWEHNEVATIATPNAGPTACPSHRYDAVWARMEGDELSQEWIERIERLERVVAADYQNPQAQLSAVLRLKELDEQLTISHDTRLERLNERILDHRTDEAAHSGIAPGTTFTAEVKP